MPLRWKNPPPNGVAYLRTISGCSAPLVALVVSHDGHHVLSKTVNQTIQLWDFRTGAERLKIGNDTAALQQPVDLIEKFSNTSKGLVVDETFLTAYSVQEDGQIGAFDLSRGSKLFVIPNPVLKFSALALGAGCQLICGSADGSITVWDAHTQKLLNAWVAHQLPITCLVTTPDGNQICSGAYDKTIRVWDAQQAGELLSLGQEEVKGIELLGGYNPLGSLAKRMKQIIAWVNALAVTPDLSRIFIADGILEEIKIWDGRTGRKMDSFQGHDSWINALSVSPDGKLLASASNDGSIKLWDILDATEIATLLGHAGPVTTVTFSPDGKFIVSGGADRTMKVWDVYAAQSRATMTDREHYAHDVSFFPDGKRYVSLGQKVNIWESASGKKVLSTTASGKPRTLRISPDGNRIIWSNSNMLMELWDPQSGAKPLTLECYIGFITAMAITPDAEKMVAGGDEYFLKVWDARTGRDVHLLRWYPEGKEPPAEAAEASPLARYERFTNPSNGVAAVTISADSRLLIAGGRDGSIKIWNLQSGKLLNTLTGHSDAVVDIVASPDGRSLISGGEDGRILIWDLRRLGKKEALSNTNGNEGKVESLAVSPDGAHFYWSSANGGVFRVNTIDKKPELLGNIGRRESNGHFRSVGVTSDARHVVAGGSSGEVIVWDAETAKKIDGFKTQAPIRCVEAVDQSLVVLDDSRRVYLLELDGATAGPRRATARKVENQIEFRCPYCNQTNKCDAAALGKDASCSGCGNSVRLNQFILDAGAKQWWRFW